MKTPRDATSSGRSPRPPDPAGFEASLPQRRAEARRILVVEDERRLREMLLVAVREMSLEPTGASSAEEALRVMDRAPSAIAVIDLNLPGQGGLELGQTIRQRWPSTELIILTGYGDLESARRAIRLDVADFLTKPCGMDELESALGRAQTRWLEKSATPRGGPHRPTEPETGDPLAPSPTAVLSLVEMERQLILAALARHNGSREAAAADLGISVRKLYYRLQQYHK